MPDSGSSPSHQADDARGTDAEVEHVPRPHFLTAGEPGAHGVELDADAAVGLLAGQHAYFYLRRHCEGTVRCVGASSRQPRLPAGDI